ncbi:hypothetical protein EON65_19420 [archaeon]|nr:MAG: hypothetical protein EON65_19420 [archaeon]
MNKASKDAFKLVDERILAEKVLSNDPAISQVREIGVDARNYRDLVGLPQVAKEAQARHNHFVHRIGADVLQTLLSDAKLQEIEREKALKKQSKVGQLLRRKIKVTDFADGGISIAIEQDWDTSSWNDNLIEAGCEALLFIFQDLGEVSSHEKKAAALQMLQKLLSRHKAADVFLRKNMEMLIMKATSHLIRGGVSGGILNLLWVLNGCKHLFLTELSNYKFNGRALDMLMVEAKIAAILIQHTFRAKRSKQQLLLENNNLLHMKGFGTDKERYYRKLRVINSRSSELRVFWRHIHDKPNNSTSAAGRRGSQSIRNNVMIGGMRGPIHIQQYHVTLALQTLAHLVSDHAGSHAHGNREGETEAMCTYKFSFVFVLYLHMVLGVFMLGFICILLWFA